MKEIRRYLDFVLFVVYIAFVSIFLHGCSTWWVWYSHCTIPLYCQYFSSSKINYKQVFAFMFKFHVFALLMHFMNRLCCSLWASRSKHPKKWYKSQNQISPNSQLMRLWFTKISSTEISWKALERLESNEENLSIKRLFYLVHFIQMFL